MNGISHRALMGLDCIQLAGITGQGRHGVYPAEREAAHTFIADIDMYCDLRAARESDRVDDTADYSVIAEAVRDVLEGDPHNLIESLADVIAQRVLDFPQVRAVRVRVHKPEAPLDPPLGDVAVTVWAGLDDLPEPAEPATDPREDEEPRDWMEHGAASRDSADFPGLDRAPDKPRSVVLSLGANLGEREQTLREVVGELDHWDGIGVTEVSPLVRTAAVLRPDQPSQPDYANVIVLVQTMLSPRELLAAAHTLEDRHGRTRDEEWGPRTLDIDIISYEGVRSEDPSLTLPHPRAGQRAFVLAPWYFIRPEAHLAGVGPIAELVEEAPDRAGIRSIDPNWLVRKVALADLEPLPLPKWEAVRDDQPARILDDPESVVLAEGPVDPLLSLERPTTPAAPLGISGVSTPAVEETDAAEEASAPAPKPSLWQRIKAFFAGSPASNQPVEVVEAEPAPPALPASLPAPADPVIVDDADTAVEGVNTRSLRQLDTAALEQVDADDTDAAADADTAGDPVLPAPPAPADPAPAPAEQAPAEEDDDDDEGEPTQPISLKDLADHEPEVPRPAPEPVANPTRQSLKDRMHEFAPVPPPAAEDPVVALPAGLAQKLEKSGADWATDAAPQTPSAPPAPAPDASVGQPTDDESPHARHARTDTDEAQATPPPPLLDDIPEPPQTQEISQADIADAAAQTGTKQPAIMRPTTTGTIPAMPQRDPEDSAQ
ncbi:2-amino-4-hydroxy-6-hydroxymethyldihydropteridine diphosphokinase [Nanchangia anserum]|uniref:Bifunctional folate synthesis protein n=1 Tax=Nanchangia anserum TaxID=2692125 RepID=A0A8I0GG85_9ACTO|nr:2-amino-4-hydroxy-6-hydroxymethyldihydropteridine diphosphokinase [Nanchangia anserum]MBD3689464.1 2-amino-4-hydroxy-6-hydroxymethyldihydropteridine diphosphokinase [Nanchangia anserum]